MFVNFVNWKYLDIWRVPVNAFSNTKKFNKELDSISRIMDMEQFKQIEQKALDAIGMTGKTLRGKAKSFDKQEISKKVYQIFKKCLND